jgi:ABC-type dipeptide/oligopeptide/nickel transport system permease subunit
VLRARELGCVQRHGRSARQRARILARHIIPTMLPAVTVQATLDIGRAILAEAGSGFFGWMFSRPRPAGGRCSITDGDICSTRRT